MIMKNIQLFQAALLLLAVGETSGFVSRIMPGRISVHTAASPLYAMLDNDPETKVSKQIFSGWKNQLTQILDVNGDGQVDHKDAASIAALACLSWSLMAAPAMATGSSHSSSSSSHSSSHSSSSSPRSSSSRSPSRSSSSISSSSSSRNKSSPYHSATASSSSSSTPDSVCC